MEHFDRKVLATFLVNAPLRCSGLDIRQYSEADMTGVFPGILKKRTSFTLTTAHLPASCKFSFFEVSENWGHRSALSHEPRLQRKTKLPCQFHCDPAHTLPPNSLGFFQIILAANPGLPVFLVRFLQQIALPHGHTVILNTRFQQYETKGLSFYHP